MSTILVLLKRHIIAFIFGLTPLDGMDNQTFVPGPDSCPNVMSISFIKMPDKEVDPLELSKKVWRPLVERHPRLRSRIIEKFGESFFEELDIEDVLQSAFTIVPEG